MIEITFWSEGRFMRYCVDTKTGNKLSALGFGCMRLPSSALGSVNVEASEKLILQALEAGINYFDTAYLYRGNEEALGAIIKRNNIRDRMFIATKLPHASVKSAADIERYFETSLKRLQTNRIDYYLIHNVVNLEQWQRLCALGIEEWITKRKSDGSINAIGFSFHGPQHEFASLLDAYNWDFCQIQYNYADENYQAGRSGLEEAYSRGIPVFIMEPLLGGKLADGLPKAASDLFLEAETAHSGVAVKDSSRVDVSVAWALRWLWNQSGVTMVLSGMNSAEQIANNVRVAKESTPNMLTETELATFRSVEKIFRESYRIPCTGCNYCMPCPKDINIPGCFASYNTSYVADRISGTIGYFMCAGALGYNPHYASDCIECGQCAKHCPQGIAIPNELKKVRRRLQIPGAKPIMSLVSKMRM
ncbi:aldo/keto reductase [Adlercreutzia sp. ZJ154]|uniref:aldo/keto reductase n=1 Tax=Adlercreutzia sp. ZJ154 TaxID=2709790 RepID=UPI00197E5D1A|nr:aldo/keto reductase [Adlercreutzia sp. ZJ154]